jgi:anti-sigma factor RsiW
MPDCEFTALVQAYHDGQLIAGRMREAEQHMSTCDACASELASLRDLSLALGAATPGPIRPDELARLHEAVSRIAVEEGDDRRVLRLAVGLSAVAASILIVSTAWLYDGSPPANPGPFAETHFTGPSIAAQGEPWENYAVGREQPEGARPTGTAINSTTDWMIGGMNGEGVHGNP